MKTPKNYRVKLHKLNPGDVVRFHCYGATFEAKVSKVEMNPEKGEAGIAASSFRQIAGQPIGVRGGFFHAPKEIAILEYGCDRIAY